MNTKDFEVIVEFGMKVTSNHHPVSGIFSTLIGSEDWPVVSGVQKATLYSDMPRFGELMVRLLKNGTKKIRVSKVHHILGLQIVKRQSGWFYVEEELIKIARGRLGGHKINKG